MTYLWAYVAGLLTLINPCVLPLLPIVIAAAFQNSRLGPLALAAGLTASFAVLGVSVTAFGHLVSVDADSVSRASAVVMMGFGVVLLVPRAQTVLATLAAPLASRANARLDARERDGIAGQFGAGVLLGAVWSPCVGPTSAAPSALPRAARVSLRRRSRCSLSESACPPCWWRSPTVPGRR